MGGLLGDRVGDEPEDVEEEGRWEGRGRTTTKGRHTGGINDNNDPPPKPPGFCVSGGIV